MPAKEVKIKEMRLRVPGVNETEAQEIGQSALRAVSSGIPNIHKIEY